jgi:mannosyl-oligosaccharide glucosidase
MQITNDTGNKLDLITQFAKISDDECGGKWGLRVKGIPRASAHDHQKTTTIFYLASEDANSRIECTEGHKFNPSNSDVVCDGTTVGLRNFKLQIPDHRADSDSLSRMSIKSLTVPADTIWQAKSIITNELKGGDSRRNGCR